jgi:hypothetical protein
MDRSLREELCTSRRTGPDSRTRSSRDAEWWLIVTPPNDSDDGPSEICPGLDDQGLFA